jgi:hypothetical protein
MTDEKHKPKLALIPCDRTAFDYEIRRALWIGTNDELDAAIEKLKPRGKLSLVSSCADDRQSGETEKGTPPE